MVFTVVPANQFIVFLDKREEAVLVLLVLLSATHLCQEPRTADDGVGLEQFQTCRGLHLTADDTGQILLHWQLVDGGDFVALHHQAQRTQKHLCLLALPVEVDPDGDIEERERGVRGSRRKGELAILVAIPENAAFGELHRLLAFDGLTLGGIGAIEGEVYLLTAHNTDRNRWLLGFRGIFLLLCFFHFVYHLCHLFIGQRQLLIDAYYQFGRQPAEVFFTGRDDETAHIHGTRADDELGITRCRVAGRTVFPAGQHHTQQRVALLPGDDVHHRFAMIFCRRQTVIKTLEETFARLHAMATDEESRSGIVGNLEDTVILVVFHNLCQMATQSLPRLLQGQATTADSLQMGMVGSRGATVRSII